MFEQLNCFYHDPIIFPKNAATIKNVKIYVWDDNPAESAWFDLYALKLNNGNNTFLGTVTTQDTAGVEVYKIVPDPANIAAGKTYTITTCFEEDIYVYGAKVLYEK